MLLRITQLLGGVRGPQKLCGWPTSSSCLSLHLSASPRADEETRYFRWDVSRLIYSGSKVSLLGVYLKTYIPVEHRRGKSVSNVGTISNWLPLELVEHSIFLLRDLHFLLFEKEFIDLKLGQFNLVACFLYVSIIYSCLCGKLSW